MVSSLGRPEFCKDVNSVTWLNARMDGGYSSPQLMVGRGFEAYARVFHPPGATPSGVVYRWAEIANANGRVVHPGMQWDAVAAEVGEVAGERQSFWSDRSPTAGHLESEELTTLIHLLESFTNTPDDCVFAVSTAWSWVNEIDVAVPRVVMPNDESYVLFCGTLQSALALGQYGPSDAFHAQSPNLFWPGDHSWCVSTDVDFDSTVVGGTYGLVDALVKLSDLEALQVSPTQRLDAHGDHLNR